MTWIDLGNPAPRRSPFPYVPVVWPTCISMQFSPHSDPEDCDLIRTLDLRRSQRSFGFLDEKKLGNLLWHCCRIQENQHADLGFPLSLRPCPSAGSIHPIHVVVSLPGKAGWMRYDPLEHALALVPDSDEAAASARLKAGSVVLPGDGVVLMFVAEPGKTFSKYTEANSLIWRDAGVLLGYFSMIAHALRLSFCPLGITGEPWASELDKQGRLIGVGLAIVGSRS